MSKLTKAQVRFLESCAEFEKGPTPHGLPTNCADMRSHGGLLDRGLIALSYANRGEYVLTPQGREALREQS